MLVSACCVWQATSTAKIVSDVLAKLVPLSCFGSSFSFYDELLVKTLGPFVLAFIIIAFGAFRWWQAKGKRKEQVKANTIEALFLLTYLVLTSVSSTVFRFFHCVEHARGRVGCKQRTSHVAAGRQRTLRSSTSSAAPRDGSLRR